MGQPLRSFSCSTLEGACGVLLLECSEDEGPGRESVLTPPVGSYEALVRTSAYAVGHPLRHRVFVGWRPSAVGLEPTVRVAHGDLRIHGDSVALTGLARTRDASWFRSSSTLELASGVGVTSGRGRRTRRWGSAPVPLPPGRRSGYPAPGAGSVPDVNECGCAEAQLNRADQSPRTTNTPSQSTLRRNGEPPKRFGLSGTRCVVAPPPRWGVRVPLPGLRSGPVRRGDGLGAGAVRWT